MRRVPFVAGSCTAAVAALVAVASCADLGALTSGGAEGGTEGGTESGSQGWCAQHGATNQVLCDDFDEGDGSLVPPWDTIATMSGGAVGISDASSVSPLSSLHAQLGAAPAGCSGIAAVSRTIQVNGESTFTLAFDFLSDGSSGLTASMLIGTAYYLAIGLGGGAYYVQQNGTFADFNATVQAGQWVRVLWTVALSGDQATVGVSLASTPDASFQSVYSGMFSQVPSPPGSVLVEIGDRCHGSDAGRDLYYDDVTFTATP